MANLDARRLAVFKAVAERLSFTEAALSLHLSQSAVSQQIASLERELGGRLFERHHRKVTLTPEGAALYERLDAILDAIASARRAVVAARGAIEGELSIAASLTVGSYLIPAPLAILGRRHPELRMRLQVANTEQVVQALLDHRADVGYVEGDVGSPGVDVRPLLEDELVIIAPAGHRFARVSEVEPEDLAIEPFVIREPGSGTRQVAEGLLAASGVQPTDLRVAAELTGIEAIKIAVESGLGVAIISRATISKELALGALLARPLAGVPMRRSISVVTASSVATLPAAKELTSLLLGMHPSRRVAAGEPQSDGDAIR